LFLIGIFPGFYYVGDFYIALGMIVASLYLFVKIKNTKLLLRTVLLVSIFGGFVTALLISNMLFLLVSVVGRNVPFMILLLDEVRIAIIIALLIGFLVEFICLGIRKIRFKENDSANNVD
jgi:hypothetical protein